MERPAPSDPDGDLVGRPCLKESGPASAQPSEASDHGAHRSVPRGDVLGPAPLEFLLTIHELKDLLRIVVMGTDAYLWEPSNKVCVRMPLDCLGFLVPLRVLLIVLVKGGIHWMVWAVRMMEMMIRWCRQVPFLTHNMKRTTKRWTREGVAPEHVCGRVLRLRSRISLSFAFANSTSVRSNWVRCDQRSERPITPKNRKCTAEACDIPHVEVRRGCRY